MSCKKKIVLDSRWTKSQTDQEHPLKKIFPTDADSRDSEHDFATPATWFWNFIRLFRRQTFDQR